MVEPLEQLSTTLDSGALALEIPDDAALLLAVSGGPDSMALLHAAAHLVATGRRRWVLTIAHLDHALRPDSPGDAAFVTEAAAALGLAAEVRRTDVAALARAEGRSIEEAAREARYRFFEAVALPKALIVTAHTADDAAETVLLNLMRGSGLAGTRGIPARRGRVVRPLLGARRETMRAHLDEAQIAYRVDPTNADPAYLRNRVRAELLPLLEQLRPGAVERIARFASLAAVDDAALDDIAASELKRRTGTEGIDWRDPPPAAIARRVLRLAVGEPAPALERIDALLSAAGGDRGGITLELGGGRVASVAHRHIRIERDP